MKKPFVIVDSEKVRVTDLHNGTSEIWNKVDDTKAVYRNTDIRATLLAMKAKEAPIHKIVAYKHKNN
ncbi:MAG: hypothetical protein WA584_23625 [Pyrinomonadaceae bacterium]